MPEQKADECEAPDILLCDHCDQPVADRLAHHTPDNPTETWSCQEPNWKERAKKAEAELTAAYNEIFWTVPEAMPLVEKIKVMHGMEADALLRAADFEKKYTELAKQAEDRSKPKKSGIKFRKLEADDHLMTWDEFVKDCLDGNLIDYDGFGELATATEVSNVSVSPETTLRSNEKPEWATHVVWYNR
jgi:hypothetical protein